MDFMTHAQILIPELTGLPLTIWEENSGQKPLELFEERFCFLPDIQTLYTVSGLVSFFGKKDGSRIYVMADALDTCAVIIKCGTKWVILGPYVVSDWQEKRAQILLAKCGAKKALCQSYKYYRCGLPLLEQSYTIRIATLLLSQTSTYTPPYEVEMIDVMAKEEAVMHTQMARKYEETEIINLRYEWEAQLVEAIRQAKTEQALRLNDENADIEAGLRFMTDNMGDQIASMAITRTLIRIGALQAGLTPVLIDSLSQEYAQRMHRAVSKQQLYELMEQYIRTICRAIRSYNQNNYSPYVKRALQYIGAYLSQPISIDDLCGLSNISRAHFVRLFGQETGKTVKQYITEERCKSAAELLENSQLPIQEISHYVGYDDTSYFSRVFKKIMGMSPQEYRKDKSFY